MDQEKAIQMHPNLNMDLTLRGETQFIKTRKIDFPVEIVPFGKYKGQKIADVKNAGMYMKWLYEQVSDERKKIIFDCHLKKIGFRMIDGVLYNEDEYNAYLKEEEFGAFLTTGKEFEIRTNYNVDYNGDLYYMHKTIHFMVIKEYYYNGISYYLPAKNGKGTRIKNRILTIKKYELLDEYSVKVLEFETKKNINYDTRKICRITKSR